MPKDFDAWSDQYYEQAFAHQTSRCESARLLVTFSTGVAVALVAIELQGDMFDRRDVVTATLLVPTFLFALATMYLDGLRWPKRHEALDIRDRRGWNDDELLHFLEGEMQIATIVNDQVAFRVQLAAQVQVLFSILTGVSAVTSLFQAA